MVPQWEDHSLLHLVTFIRLKSKMKFYRRFVDDIFNRREKDVRDFLFNSLKNYNQNLALKSVQLNSLT